uniref:Uncharacterized protein n=1 Tax=Rhizophora mucronata TaxID=61149 RepID=A0A2P2PJM0_RHIMU
MPCSIWIVLIFTHWRTVFLSLVIAIVGGRFSVDGNTNGIEFILPDCLKLPAHGDSQCRHRFPYSNIFFKLLVYRSSRPDKITSRS